MFLILFILSFLFMLFYGCKRQNPAAPVILTATDTRTVQATTTATFGASTVVTITVTNTVTETVFQTYTATRTATATSTPRAFDHITIKAAGGVPIGNQVAGVPFNISMTAWADAGETSIAQNFNGVNELRASNSYALSEYCMSPTSTLLFINGFAYMSVTMYRASDTDVTIGAYYGNQVGFSNGFKIAASYPNGFLWLLDGMTHKPGLVHLGIPGYQGFEGCPESQQAGIPFNMTLLLVDGNYNRVTNTAAVYPQITSSDPLASVNGIQCAAGVYVTMTAGIFTSTDAVLQTIPAAGYQLLTAEHGLISNKTAPPISVYGAVDHFSSYLSTPPPPLGTACGVSFGVYDANNYAIYSANSIYRVTSDDSGATINSNPLPQDITLTNGLASFYVTFSTLGGHTVYMNDTLASALPGGNLSVTSVAPYYPHISAYPQSVILGTESNVDFWLTDNSGNTITGYYGDYTISSSDADATVNGWSLPTSVFLNAGVVNFPILFSSAGLHTVYLNGPSPVNMPGCSITITATAP